MHTSHQTICSVPKKLAGRDYFRPAVFAWQSLRNNYVSTYVHMYTQSCIHIIIGVILKEKMNDTSMIFTHYPGFKPDNIDAPYFKDQVSEC